MSGLPTSRSMPPIPFLAAKSIGMLSQKKDVGSTSETVQIIPHVINEIKNFIYTNDKKNLDIAICEIGGTVGDIESQPFLETIRQVARKRTQ